MVTASQIPGSNYFHSSDEGGTQARSLLSQEHRKEKEEELGEYPKKNSSMLLLFQQKEEVKVATAGLSSVALHPLKFHTPTPI